MNSSTLKDIFNSRRLLAAVLCTAAVALTMILWRPWNPQRVLRAADKEAFKAYKACSEKSFDAATNALVHYIEYLESRKKRLSPYRDVTLMLSVAHAELAYMLLYTGDEVAACAQFKKAFDYHRQLRVRGGYEPRSRAEFVGHVIAGIEKIHAKNGAAWKSGHTLNSNTVEKVKLLFVAEQ